MCIFFSNVSYSILICVYYICMYLITSHIMVTVGMTSPSVNLLISFFGLEDLYLTKRINRKHKIHSHKSTLTGIFTCTYTHTINTGPII